MNTTSLASAKPGYNPLYLQVKRQLVERMAAGEWLPGSVLPSEHQLAEQLEVSQGTVRKALAELTSENLLVRQQGRGTFVAEHDQKRTLFQFFKLTPDGGTLQWPDTTRIELTSRRATVHERAALGLAQGAFVWRLLRHRTLDGNVAVVERITLAKDLFPDIDRHDPLPNNIYRLYERAYGMTIVRAAEELRAVGASRADAKALGCREGYAVLKIERTAYGLTGNTIELRESVCLTDNVHYLSDLR
ncbi:MAG: GntR family transcriptional regulator [Alphaproteobacteria bacterium]